MSDPNAVASELLVAQKEQEYQAVLEAYHNGDESQGPRLAELAAEFDAMRTAHLEAYGPAPAGDGDAVVVTEPVESSAANLGLEE